MTEELKEVFEGLRKRYKPGTFERTTTYYFSLGEEPGLKWTVTLGPNSCRVKEGKNTNADCVLKTSPHLFIKMVNGKYKPGPIDFVMGKVKSNDPEKLRLLAKAFSVPN